MGRVREACRIAANPTSRSGSARCSLDPVMITIATTGSSTSRDHARYVPFAPKEIADEIHPSWQAGRRPLACTSATQKAKPVWTSRGFAAWSNLSASAAMSSSICHRRDSRGRLARGACDRLPSCIRRWPLPMRDPPISAAGSLPSVRPFSVSCRRHGATGQARDRSVRAGFHQHRPRPCQAGLAATSPALPVRPRGRRGVAPATPKYLLHVAESLPAGSTCSVIGVGKAQFPMAAMAIVMGGLTSSAERSASKEGRTAPRTEGQVERRSTHQSHHGCNQRRGLLSCLVADYLGAKGIGTPFLLREIPPDVDPLSEQNKLILASAL